MTNYNHLRGTLVFPIRSLPEEQLKADDQISGQRLASTETTWVEHSMPTSHPRTPAGSPQAPFHELLNPPRVPFPARRHEQLLERLLECRHVCLHFFSVPDWISARKSGVTPPNRPANQRSKPIGTNEPRKDVGKGTSITTLEVVLAQTSLNRSKSSRVLVLRLLSGR